MSAESVELKKLCLYLSRQRQTLLTQMSLIGTTKNDKEEMSEEEALSNNPKSNLDLIENNNSNLHINGAQACLIF